MHKDIHIQNLTAQDMPLHEIIHTHIHTCMHACIIHTYIHTSIHTYIRAYIHTCIHTSTEHEDGTGQAFMQQVKWCLENNLEISNNALARTCAQTSPQHPFGAVVHMQQ